MPWHDIGAARLRSNILRIEQITNPRFRIYIFQSRYIPDRYDLAHVARWILLYSVHDRSHASWVGSVPQYTDPAQHLKTADKDLDHLDRDLDRDLSGV